MLQAELFNELHRWVSAEWKKIRQVTNVYREDEVRPGLTQRQALAAAPAAEQGRFRVPRILDLEEQTAGSSGSGAGPGVPA